MVGLRGREVLACRNSILVLLIHAHQPVGNFDDVMERTYERSYLPFVECVARHPRVRLGLHYSGSLLEWLAEKHPEYIQRVGALVGARPGGDRRRRILRADPDRHSTTKIGSSRFGGLSDFIEEHFGKRPAGAWLAERVWEPQLPAALAEAGVEYTLVDDSHFLTAGREMPELFGYYIAEDRGRTVKVIPGLAGTSLPAALRHRRGFRRVPSPVRQRPSGRNGLDGRRHGEIRRLAAYL